MASSFNPPVSAGIIFNFAGHKYTATSISVSRSASQEVDCTSTDISGGGTGCKRYRTGGIENVDIKVDWVGLIVPPVTATATFVLSGANTGAMGATGSIALCTGLSVSATAGDLIKGSATFKVSGA